MLSGFCDSSQLGRFILDLPAGTSVDDTSFWSARVQLPNSEPTTSEATKASSFWDDPNGNPPSPPDPSGYTTPWKRGNIMSRGRNNPSPNSTYTYDSPIKYNVRKTGYYCVGASCFADYHPRFMRHMPVNSHRSSHRSDHTKRSANRY